MSGFGGFPQGNVVGRRTLSLAMPDARTNTSTGAHRLNNPEPMSGPLVFNKGSINAPNNTPAMAPPNPTPSRSYRLAPNGEGVVSDGPKSVLLGETLGKRRADFGGTPPADLAAMKRWAGDSTGLPRLGGLPAPDPTQEVRGPMGYPMYGGFAPFRDLFPDGPMPNERTPGTGGIAWGGFGSPPTDLFTHQPGPGGIQRAPGQGPGGMFQTLSETGNGTVAMRNLFMTYPWGEAERKLNEGEDIESKVNAPVPFHFLVESKFRSFCHENQEGQIVLTQRTPHPVPNRRAGNLPAEQSPYISTNLLNLPTFNYMQACNEPMPAEGAEAMSPEQILEQWSLTGIVRNDPSSAMGPGAARDSVQMANQWQRIINVMFGGQTFVFNYWGNNVLVGTKLYLILKKVPREKIKATPTSAEGTYKISVEASASEVQVSDPTRSTCPFQFVPWQVPPHGGNEPTPKDLEYYDEYGILKHGVAFSLGMVDQIDHFDSLKRTRDSAPFNVEATLALPRIRVLVNVRMLR